VPTNGQSSITEPSGRRRLLLRTSVLLFTLAAAYLGYQKFSSFMVDPDIGAFQSEGMVAALESVGEGTRAVIFDAQGNKLFTSGEPGSTTDRDLVWRPDGNRLIFTSDREKGVFQVFRWNPTAKKIEVRSTGTTSKAHPTFGPPGYKMAEWTGLLVSGGFVREFDPRKGTMMQILPPVVGAQQVEGEEGGAGGQFETLYKSLGSSFREAKWGKDRKSVVAIMRSDEGEILIRQPLELQASQDGPPSFPAPITLAAGDRIDFDVAADGTIAYSVVGFRWPDMRRVPPEFIKDNKVTRPYEAGLFVHNPESNTQVTVFVDQNGEQVVERPVFNPTGDRILARGSVKGKDGGFEVRALLLLPVEEAGVSKATPLATGNITGYAWAPDGIKVAYTVRDKGKGALSLVDVDGSNRRTIGSDSDYSDPVFSPQVASPSK
jgi:hypothetical protein